MIAADTSSIIAYLAGEPGDDTTLFDRALADQQIVLPPVVLSELLSEPKLTPSVERLLVALPLLPMQEGYWQRAGKLRAILIAKKIRARLADTLIAQSCLDSDTALITRDADFRAFTHHAGLHLLPDEGLLAKS